MSVLNLAVKWSHNFQNSDDISNLPVPFRALAGGAQVIVAAETAFLHVSGRIIMQLAPAVSFDKSRVFLLRLVGWSCVCFQPIEGSSFHIVLRAAFVATWPGMSPVDTNLHAWIPSTDPFSKID